MDLAAFFGRVLLAVDYLPGFEARIAAAQPLARYAAFIVDADARYHASEALCDEHPAFWSLIRVEEIRMRHDHPTEWADGSALALAAGLDGPG